MTKRPTVLAITIAFGVFLVGLCAGPVPGAARAQVAASVEMNAFRSATSWDVQTLEATSRIHALLQRLSVEQHRAHLATGRARSRSETPAPAGALQGGQLRLPDAAFSPATVNPSYDYVETPGAADQNWFRNNHWWSYTRMGMTSGYYEEADAEDSAGNPVIFHWQPTVYGNAAQANAALKDGISRSSQYDSNPIGCWDIYHVPCMIFAYGVDQTSTEVYELFQVNQCVGESAATADSGVYENASNAISKTAAVVDTIGVALLKADCKGGQAPSPRATATPTSSQSGPNITGNACYAFRGEMWNIAQKNVGVIDYFWTRLQDDYGGNYPPSTGGSVPGVTQDQFVAAQTDMNTIHDWIDDQSQNTGLEFDLYAIGHKYGIPNLTHKDPFTWAMSRVYGTSWELDQAAYKEWVQAGTGLDDYHLAQMYQSNSWDALKQLPCHPSAAPRPSPTPTQVRQPAAATGSFSVKAWVSPSTMSYNSYPTLYAKTTPGAACTASVTYTTGRPPASFNGSARTVGSSGTVGWSWHEETKVGGGTGYVSCSYAGHSASATATFTVTG